MFALQAFGKASWFVKDAKPVVTEPIRKALGELGIKPTDAPRNYPDNAGGYEMGTWGNLKQFSILLDGVELSKEKESVNSCEVRRFVTEGMREKVLSNFAGMELVGEEGSKGYVVGVCPVNGITALSRQWVEGILLPLLTDETDPPVLFFS